MVESTKGRPPMTKLATKGPTKDFYGDRRRRRELEIERKKRTDSEKLKIPEHAKLGRGFKGKTGLEALNVVAPPGDEWVQANLCRAYVSGNTRHYLLLELRN
jgi:hypothetical protein